MVTSFAKYKHVLEIHTNVFYVLVNLVTCEEVKSVAIRQYGIKNTNSSDCDILKVFKILRKYAEIQDCKGNKHALKLHLDYYLILHAPKDSFSSLYSFSRNMIFRILYLKDK